MEAREATLPDGKIIEIPVMLENRIIIVACRDFELNHSCYCWQCSAEELAIIIAYRTMNLELPPELVDRHIVIYPDLGREHVTFMVNGQAVDVSLYGLVPVNLVSDA